MRSTAKRLALDGQGGMAQGSISEGVTMAKGMLPCPEASKSGLLAPRLRQQVIGAHLIRPLGGFRFRQGRRPQPPSVNSVTYGVSYQPENRPQTLGFRRQSYPHGSETNELWFRN